MRTGTKCAAKFVKKVRREIECHVVVLKDGVARARARVLPHVASGIRLITSHYPCPLTLPFFLRPPVPLLHSNFILFRSFLGAPRVQTSKRERDTIHEKICQGMAVNSLKLALINKRYVALRTNFRQVRYNRKM